MPTEYPYRCEQCGADLTEEDRVVKTVRVLWKDTDIGEPFREELPGEWFHEACWDSQPPSDHEEADRGSLGHLWQGKAQVGRPESPSRRTSGD